MTKSIGTGSIAVFWSWIRQQWKALLLGNSTSDIQQSGYRLPLYLALPLIAASLFSTLTYVIDEILLAFNGKAVSSANAVELLPLICVILVLAVLLVSYSCITVIQRFNTMGGYSFVRKQLGTNSGLVAAIALAIGYVMTIAVSISAATAFLCATFPILTHNTTLFALLLLFLLTLFNLRAVRTAGWWLTLPSYSFIIIIILLIVSTLLKFPAGATLSFALIAGKSALYPLSSAGLLVLFQAISYGGILLAGLALFVDAEKSLQGGDGKKATQRLLLVMISMLLLFFGIAQSATIAQLNPALSKLPVIMQLARLNFAGGFLYYFTAVVSVSLLLLAAHVTFSAFPILAAKIARDGFLPKSLSRNGDRLVYARGILALSIGTGLLLLFFRANLHALIGLYALGLFFFITLLQIGVIKEALWQHEKGWQWAVLLGAAGSLLTAMMTLVVAFSKFESGSWVVLLLIPILLLIIRWIKQHYDWFDSRMKISADDDNPLNVEKESMTVIVLLSSDIHRGILEGLECGRSIVAGHPDARFRALHVEIDNERSQRLRQKWAKFVQPYLGDSIQLDIIPSPYRWLIEPIINYLDNTMQERPDDRIIVVLPEFETGSMLTQFLHNFTADRLRSALLSRPRITLVSSRFFMKPMAWRHGRGGLVY